jgi:hypothetical protein
MKTTVLKEGLIGALNADMTWFMEPKYKEIKWNFRDNAYHCIDSEGNLKKIDKTGKFVE